MLFVVSLALLLACGGNPMKRVRSQLQGNMKVDEDQSDLRLLEEVFLSLEPSTGQAISGGPR